MLSLNREKEMTCTNTKQRHNRKNLDVTQNLYNLEKNVVVLQKLNLLDIVFNHLKTQKTISEDTFVLFTGLFYLGLVQKLFHFI